MSSVEQVQRIEQSSNHEGRVGVLTAVIRYLTPEPTSRWRWRASPLRFLGLASLFLGVRGDIFKPNSTLTLLGDSVFSGSGAGDVNGDGIADLLVGAPYSGVPASGRTYVVFGRSGLDHGGDLDLSTLDGTNGFVIIGHRNDDESGTSVASAGDVNADGIADILIGATKAKLGNQSKRFGRAYVIFGKRGLGSGGTLALSGLDGTNGFWLNGESAGDWCGDSVSGAGDVNGDGVDDFMIGAPFANPFFKRDAGTAYVVFGRAGIGASGVMKLSSLDGTNGFAFKCRAVDQLCGSTVSGSGDVNGDGIGDLLIAGSPGYLVFGDRNLGAAGSLAPSSLNGRNGMVIDIGSTTPVAGAGDINNDGIDDVLIGMGLETRPGKTYAVFGSRNLGADGRNLEHSASGLIISGVPGTGYARGSVSGAGDVNADGVADILIGATYGPMDLPGRVSVVLGSKELAAGTLSVTDLNGINGARLATNSTTDGFGQFVSGIGDVNNDGVADVLATASRAGAAYVLFGQKAMPPSTSTSTLSTSVQSVSTTGNSVAGSTQTALGSRSSSSVTTNTASSLSETRATATQSVSATGSSARPTIYIYATSPSGGLDPAILIGIAGAVCALGSSVFAAILAVKCRRKGDVTAEEAGQAHGYANLPPKDHYIDDAELQVLNKAFIGYLEGKNENVPEY